MLPTVWLLPSIRNLAISTHGSWLVQVRDDDDVENHAEDNGDDVDVGDDDIIAECLHPLPREGRPCTVGGRQHHDASANAGFVLVITFTFTMITIITILITIMITGKIFMMLSQFSWHLLGNLLLHLAWLLITKGLAGSTGDKATYSRFNHDILHFCSVYVMMCHNRPSRQSLFYFHSAQCHIVTKVSLNVCSMMTVTVHHNYHTTERTHVPRRPCFNEFFQRLLETVSEGEEDEGQESDVVWGESPWTKWFWMKKKSI